MDKAIQNLNQPDPAGQTYTMISNDLLTQMLLELKACRLALVTLACEGRRAVPSDFDPVKNPELENG